MFFFKKSKIYVDCFTTSEFRINVCPITRSTKQFPEWWKKIPGTIPFQESNGISIDRSTMKRCNGFLDLYKNSFTLPMWTDFKIEIGQEEDKSFLRWYISDDTEVTSHDSKQWANNFSQFKQIKILSPWRLKEKTGCKFAFISPSWSLLENLKDFHIMPGVVDYKYQHSTHVNMFVPYKIGEYIINVGTPLAHIIPLTEKHVEFNCHVVDDIEYKKIMTETNYPTFNGGYSLLKKTVEKNESNKKCPFH